MFVALKADSLESVSEIEMASQMKHSIIRVDINAPARWRDSQAQFFWIKAKVAVETRETHAVILRDTCVNFQSFNLISSAIKSELINKRSWQ